VIGQIGNLSFLIERVEIFINLNWRASNFF